MPIVYDKTVCGYSPFKPSKFSAFPKARALRKQQGLYGPFGGDGEEHYVLLQFLIE
jgi:hypothetical protein